MAEAAAWDKKFQAFLDADQSRAKQIDAYLNRTVPADIKEQLLAAAPVDKPVASRASSGVVLQKAAELVPALFGGAADLAPSTKTDIKGGGDFTPENPAGRNRNGALRNGDSVHLDLLRIQRLHEAGNPPGVAHEAA